MAHGSNLRSSSPENYQTPGSVCLFFRKEGSSDDADWKSLGNLVDPSIGVALERLSHFSQRRGQRAKDAEIISERSMTLNFSIDEINLHNMQFAFGSDADPVADDTVDTLMEDTFVNPGVATEVINLGVTNLVAGSAIVRDTDLEPAAGGTTYVDPTDYTFDEAAGTITIVAAGALEGGPAKVHIFWKKNVNTQKFTIFSGAEIKGEAQFQVLTPGGFQWLATLGSVVIRNNGDVTLGDGTAWQEVPLTMEVLVDSKGDLGVLHVVDADEL